MKVDQSLGYRGWTAAMIILMGSVAASLPSIGRGAGEENTRSWISDIAGETTADGLIITWEIPTSESIAGFYLDREVAGGQTLRLNRRMLPALPGVLPSSYRLLDKAAGNGSWNYVLTVVDLYGRSHKLGPFEIDPLARPPSESAIAGRATVAPTAPSTREVAAGPPGDRVKITVNHEDLYYASASDIADCLSGLTEAQVIAAISQTNLNLTWQGQDVSWMQAAGNSGITFYAQGIKSIFTTNNIYWISVEEGVNSSSQLATTSVPVVTNRTFRHSITIEEHHQPSMTFFDDPDEDYWVGDFIYYPFAGWDAKSFLFTVHDPAPKGSGSVSMDVMLCGGSDILTDPDPDHSLRASLTNINGLVAVGEKEWTGIQNETISLSFTGVSWLVDGENTMFLEALVHPVAYSLVYLDKFTLVYPRYYRAVNDRLGFGANSNVDITVSAFSSTNITLLDVTDPVSPVRISTTNISQAPTGDYRVSFVPSSQTGTYFAAVSPAAPASIEGVADTHWRDSTNQLDYVIVTVDELLTQANQLADYRADQGLKTGVIKLQEVYDEFNHGIVTPWAIRSFLSYAVANWQTAPRYVVLGGSGTVDFMNYKGTAAADPCHVPPVIVLNSFGLFGCDNPMADLDGDSVIDIAIGRLSVRNTTEFNAVIDKIVAYEAGGTWRDTVMLVADNPDSGGDFWTSCDTLAARVAPECTVDKLYVDGTGSNIASVRSGLQDGLNAGTGLFTYMGHASTGAMADPIGDPAKRILESVDLPYLTNSARPSLMMAMTCQLGRFALLSTGGGLGEALVSTTEGGAVAMWAPVSESFNDEGTVMGNNMFDAIFTNQNMRLGDAVKQAFEDFNDEAATAKFLLKTFALLGDPGLVVRGPAPVASDYGDAPLPYATRLSDLGAYHVIVDGVHLGARVDPEEDGLVHALALGDDNDGSNDDDGVVFTTPFAPGQPLGVDVTASTAGVLSAWVDFNGDGDWGDADEQIFEDEPLVQGLNALTSSVPGSMTSSNTFARFRFSTTPGLSPTGGVAEGEVEDYMVSRVTTLVGLTSFGAFESDGTVVVRWETSFEMNSSGFILEREVDGSFVRINPLVIPAMGGGPYEVVDAGVVPGQNYTYRLVEIEVSGLENIYGPYNVYVKTSFEEWQSSWFTAVELGDPSISGADADSDGDGHANSEEFAAGTNPLDGTSVLRIVLVQQTGARSFRLEWESKAGKAYAVERSSSPGGSYIHRTTVTATGPRTELVDDADDKNTWFYRVRLVVE